MRRWSFSGAMLALLCTLGCHREIEMVPLADRTIYTTDRFYDVHALSEERAFVVGYAGKILETTDGGRTWSQRPSGVQRALYAIRMVDDDHGWICGQDGLILHTSDGGKTWEKQQSNAIYEDARDGTKAPVYLFALHALDANHAWAVGDRSILTSTTDGGKTWRSRQVPMETDLSGGQSLAAADPIFYDVKFTDPQTGWIVGEFGKILHTSDGGETWHEQEQTLLEGTDFFDLLDLPTMYGIHIDGTNGVTAGLEGHLARTTDGGETWKFDEIHVDYPLVDPLFRVLELPDGTGWAVGAAGEVVRHGAGEATWRRADLGQNVLTWLRGLSFSDLQHGWIVGGFGLIYRTTDGGKTWLPSG